MTGESVYIQKNVFENMTYVSLDHHFVTWRLIPETMMNVPYKMIDFLQTFIPAWKYNKRQIIALLKGNDIFFIYLTSFRSNQTAGKNDIGQRVSCITGKSA